MSAASQRRIKLRFEYTLRGNLANLEYVGFSAPVVVIDAAEPVAITLISENTIRGEWNCAVSDELGDRLEGGGIDLRTFPEPIARECGAINKTIVTAAKRFVHVLKYYLAEHALDEGVSVKLDGKAWSMNGTDWRQYPYAVTAKLLLYRGHLPFDELSQSGIRELLLSGEQLLPFSMKHLHRAFTELDPKHKWIEATIAAELAIKEFLIRFHPPLETFILEVPSPPLPKMYGAVLKSFAGVESPMKTELDKGAQTRNKLIHRPLQLDISDEDAMHYAYNVERAIYHLLTLLRPRDEFLSREFAKMMLGAKSR